MVACSVLIPTYNGEKYLRRALDSVINQTFQDFEIILIDDGSTDSTPQICDEYAEKYGGVVHVFHQKNVGISKTCEKLLENANGKYIFWLYHDDYLEKTLLGKAVEGFERNNADIVVFGIVLLENDGEKRENKIEELGVQRWRKTGEWGLQSGAMLIATARKLWDKWDKFPSDVEIVDDVWMTSQIIQKSEKIVSLGECLYYCERRNMDSATRSYKARRIFQEGMAYYKIIKKFQEDPSGVSLILQKTRMLLVNAYCVNQVRPSLTTIQPDQIKDALEDLRRSFPQQKMKKFYLIQFCVLHGIDRICAWYGKSRIRNFYRNF